MDRLRRMNWLYLLEDVIYNCYTGRRRGERSLSSSVGGSRSSFSSANSGTSQSQQDRDFVVSVSDESVQFVYEDGDDECFASSASGVGEMSGCGSGEEEDSVQGSMDTSDGEHDGGEVGVDGDV